MLDAARATASPEGITPLRSNLGGMELEAALKAFRLRHPRASNRQEAIQTYAVRELSRRGLHGARIEVPMPGQYRVKKWDVGLTVDTEPRLAISCKSIISNFGGTVPNRVDDMLGEAVSLHRAYPRAVLGYLFMMGRIDESVATKNRTAKGGGPTPERIAALRKEGDIWFERLVQSVSRATERRDEEDYPEKFEVVSCAQIDFSTEPYSVVNHPGALKPSDFFDALVARYRERFG